jgi:hypothetical protein
MEKVTKTEFYKIIYDRLLDVHPYPVARYDNKAGYTIHWKLKNGELFGITRNLDPFENHPTDFYQVASKYLKEESAYV